MEAPMRGTFSRTGMGEPGLTHPDLLSHLLLTLAARSVRTHIGSNISVPYCFVTSQSLCGSSGRHREVCAEVSQL